MTMSRYEIRNEYGLADRELYNITADNEDPEAVLEGIAMAGLVGVLRQLGDLAQFAAEIFHDLHVQAMSISERGHGLSIRVQQLETEVPAIEEAFLTQTDHSSFFHHAGVDWHPNLRIDHNLVTEGDFPRFITASYQECRAPPRLLLLDKFDAAGAGACLKRYTDPSFFKVENCPMPGADVQVEKKLPKSKKKRPHQITGGTPEILPTSRTKLHLLFLEERLENDISNTSSNVKLKRKLNGFPFEKRIGKSYMEKLLKEQSPDHKVLQEVTKNVSHLILAMSEYNESSVEAGIGPLSSNRVNPLNRERQSVERKRSPYSPSVGEEISLIPTIHKQDEIPADDSWVLPNSYCSTVAEGISSTLDKVNREEVIAVDRDRQREGSLAGYHSDDLASEIGNYVDAPSSTESEMDTNSEPEVKSGFTSSYLKDQTLTFDANKENFHNRSSDCHSCGHSTVSDEGNNSSRKEISNSSSSDSLRSLGDSPQSENISAEVLSPADIPETDMANASSYQKTNEDFQVDRHSNSLVYGNACTDTEPITDNRSYVEQLASSLRCAESLSALVHSDSEELVRKGTRRESNETTSNLDDKEKKISLVKDPVSYPHASDSELQSPDNPSRSSLSEPLVDKALGQRTPCKYTRSNIQSYTTDNSVTINADSLNEDESGSEDQNMVENIASPLNMCNAHSQNRNDAAEVSAESPIPCKFAAEVPDLLENSLSYNPNTDHIEENIESTVSKRKNPTKLHNEDSNVFADASDRTPFVMETSLAKKLKEAFISNFQTVNAEDNDSSSYVEQKISPESLLLSHPANSPDCTQAGLGAHDRDAIPEEETTVNETLALGTPRYCEVAGLCCTGTTDRVFPNNSAALESSICTPENVEGPAGIPDALEADGITMCTNKTLREGAEVLGSTDLKSLNELHVLPSDESHPEEEKSGVVGMAPDVPTVSDNVIIDVNLPVCHDSLVKERISCFEDSDLHELETDNCFSRNHGESGLVEEVSQIEALPSWSETFCDTITCEDPKSELSDSVPNSHLELDANHSFNFSRATAIQSLAEQSGSNTAQQFFQQSGLVNPISDAPSFPIDNVTEEPMVHEKFQLPPDQLAQEFLDSSESSKSPPLYSINDQQMLYHDDHRENDSTSKFSPGSSPIPPLGSELAREGNNVIDVCADPKDQLYSIFSSGDGLTKANQIILADSPPMPPLPPVQWRMGKLKHALSATEAEITEHNEVSQGICEPTTSNDDISPSFEEINHSLVQFPHLGKSEEEKAENCCSSLDAEKVHEKIDHLPETESKQPEAIMPTPVSEFALPAQGDEVANGSRTVRLFETQNTLIDTVAALDKSKLRKVTERVRPQIEVDERDSFLEQIKAKSLNLKPALASRPSIRGPRTNLKVAAILEKANAMRQALAGSSDDDDDESWNDS